jgi:hypothetical protein
MPPTLGYQRQSKPPGRRSKQRKPHYREMWDRRSRRPNGRSRGIAMTCKP